MKMMQRKVLCATALLQGATAIKVGGDGGGVAALTAADHRQAAMLANQENVALKELQKYFYEDGAKVQMTQQAANYFLTDEDRHRRDHVLTSVKLIKKGDEDLLNQPVKKTGSDEPEDSGLIWMQVFDMRFTKYDKDKHEVELSSLNCLEAVVLACQNNGRFKNGKIDFKECFTIAETKPAADIEKTESWDVFAERQHAKNQSLMDAIEQERLRMNININNSIINTLDKRKQDLANQLFNANRTNKAAVDRLRKECDDIDKNFKAAVQKSTTLENELKNKLKAAEAAKEQALNDLNERIRELDVVRNDLQKKQNDLEQDRQTIDSLNAEIQDKKSALQSLTADHDSIMLEKAALEQKLKLMEADNVANDDLKIKLDRINKEYQESLKKVQDANTAANQAELERVKLNQTLDYTKQQLAEANADREKAMIAASNQSESLKQSLQESEQNAAEMKKRHDDLLLLLKTAESDLETKSKTQDGFKVQLQSMRDLVDTNETRAKELQEEINGYKQRITDLQEEINGYKQRITDLQEENNGLQEENNGLQEENNGLQKENKGLRTKNALQAFGAHKRKAELDRLQQESRTRAAQCLYDVVRLHVAIPGHTPAVIMEDVSGKPQYQDLFDSLGSDKVKEYVEQYHAWWQDNNKSSLQKMTSFLSSPAKITEPSTMELFGVDVQKNIPAKSTSSVLPYFSM